MTVAAPQHDGSHDRATEATHDRVAEPARDREPQPAPAPVVGARGTHDLAALPVGASRATSVWRGPILQTKLAVSVPGDPFEREADAVAARVVRGADARPPKAPDLAVRGRLLRAAAPARGPPTVTGPSERGPPSIGSIVAQGGGRPLDTAVRARIEPHVGMDLGSVRVRDGPDAAAAAHALQARAFTSGSTIFLAASSSPTDVGLMAHEATHVVQQTARPATRSTLMRAFGDLLPDVSLPDISVADVIPASVLDGVRSLVQSIPGYSLLTEIAGLDPLTGQPVQVSHEQLIDQLLSYGPFDAAASGVLQAVGVVDRVFDVISGALAAHNLTLARIQGDIDSAWSQLSIAGGIEGNVAIVRGFVERLLADVAALATSIAEQVIELVRTAAATLAATLLDSPVWSLAKKVMHYDPLLGVPVEAPTVEILGDFLRLAGEEERLAQMEERGTLQETADWLDTQFAIWIGLIGELTALFTDAWAAIQPQNLPDLPANLAALAVRAIALVQGVALFEATVISKVLELVRHALLGWLSEYAHVIPGFHLLTVIIGQNPFTGEPVQLTAENLIRGFITLIPGGEATYDQFAESGVIAAAAGRIEAAITDLGLTPELVAATFLGIWNSLTLDDLLDPPAAFVRVLESFAEPLLRIVRFVPVVVQVVIELVLRLMNFPFELLGSIYANVTSAISDIARDPIGFLMNMVAALKDGFIAFFANIVGHLTQGLVDWLFRGLRHLGITAPPDFSLASILDLIFQVLGLTAEALWAKLAEHVPAETVALIRGSIDKLTGAWAFLADVQERGLVAIWELVSDQLGSLWQTVLSAAMEWVMTQVITSGTIKLLSFLDPTFIMSIINGCIALFNAVQAAIEYLRDMLEILNLYVGTLAQVAAGNIAPGAQMIEQGFAAAVPVAIGFLAYLLGIDDIPYQIARIIESVRGVIDKALDWLIEQALRLGSAALAALSGGGAPGASGAAPAAAGAAGRVAEAPVVPEVGPPHVVYAEADAAGHVQIGMQSEPQLVRELVAYFEPRLDRLPRSAKDLARIPPGGDPNHQPWMQATSALARIVKKEAALRPYLEGYLREAATSPRGPDDNLAVMRLRDLGDDIKLLLLMFAVYDRETDPISDEPAGGQKLNVRMTVLQEAGGTVLPTEPTTGGLLGVDPTTKVSGAGKPVALAPTPGLATPTTGTPDKKRSRGVVLTGVQSEQVPAGAPPARREVVVRAWAIGGTPDFASNTSHTERQFEHWFAEQGPDFARRVADIEVRSTLSPCAACTDVLVGIRRTIVASKSPGDPPLVSVLFWDKVFAPTGAQRSAGKVALQTRAYHVQELSQKGWIVHGPQPGE